VNISLDQLHRDEFLSVIGMELGTTGEPAIDQRIMPQNGYLVLQASRGKLHHGSDSKETGLRGVGAAGELHQGSGHSSLDGTGCLIEWQNPTDRIEWEMFWPEASNCQIKLVTVSRVHSAPWTAGQKIQLTYTQDNFHRQWETVLTGHPIESAGSQCYSQGLADGGSLSIPGSGMGKLRISMIDPGSSDALMMGLREVRIQLV
jgi:hypothetical protein